MNKRFVVFGAALLCLLLAACAPKAEQSAVPAPAPAQQETAAPAAPAQNGLTTGTIDKVGTSWCDVSGLWSDGSAAGGTLALRVDETTGARECIFAAPAGGASFTAELTGFSQSEEEHLLIFTGTLSSVQGLAGFAAGDEAEIRLDMTALSERQLRVTLTDSASGTAAGPYAMAYAGDDVDTFLAGLQG